MQKWTQPSRCIFCQYRASAPKRGVVREPRSFCTTNHKFTPTETSAKKFKKSRSTSKDGRRLNDKGKDFPHIRGIQAKVEHLRTSNEKEERIPSRILALRALKRTLANLRSEKMSKTSSVSQLDGLDPRQTLWPEFEDNMRQIIDTRPAPGGACHISDYFGVKKQELADNVDRLVKFAFLDFVLDRNRGVRAQGEMLDLRYPTEWYPSARQLQRVVHLHVGPTNSGKTYNALKRLEQAGNGFYAGPLRLLAHEVYSRFNSRGIKCNLVTGDDVRYDDSGEVKLYASTVEMVDSGKRCDVGVIDEIQMLGDNERGWAWTRALLSAQAKELHLCGETRVVPLVREIVASMGDTLHIHQYERLNPLKVMSKSLRGNLKNLRQGDCIVCFSIVQIHAMKRQIELDTGKRCAIIYGSLPPETRAQQAALFNDPDNDYDFLAASDAIGMGLNLSIKRIIFETTMKFNGVRRERLSVPQIKQIAGRAGRYRTSHDDKSTDANKHKQTTGSSTENPPKPKSIGLVTCLDELDLPVLQKALSSDGPPLKAAGILPPGEFYEELASSLPENTPFEYILRRIHASVATNERFRVCDIRDNLEIAKLIEPVEDLSLKARLTFSAAPATFNSTNTQDSMSRVLIALAKAVGSDTPVNVADVQEIPLEILDEPITSERSYLASLEHLHKALILFLWLSYRFPRALRDQDMAVRAKELCEEKINTTLLKVSANPKLRERLNNVRKSSELLSEQTRARGWVTDMPLIMNPDQTVEEIEAETRAREGALSLRNDQDLEEHVPFAQQLDVGEEQDMSDAVGQVGSDIQNLSAEPTGETVEEQQRAAGSG